MPSLWRWEPKLSRYRNAETGRFIGAKGMVELRDLFVERQRRRRRTSRRGSSAAT